MSVSRKGKSITFTADADTYATPVFVAGLTMQVSGGSAGDRLRVTDSGGSVIADYLVMAATDNADLWAGRGPQFYDSVLIEDFPSGTCVLTLFVD
jgi:hypothetical protein